MNNLTTDGYKLSHEIPATEHPVAASTALPSAPEKTIVVRSDSGDWRDGVEIIQKMYPNVPISVYVTVRGMLVYLTGTAEQIIAHADQIENNAVGFEKIMHDFGLRGNMHVRRGDATKTYNEQYKCHDYRPVRKVS